MMFAGKRILILAPHTDDAEIGCGGLVARYAAMAEIYVVAFSQAKESTITAGFNPEVLVEEFYSATSTLGIEGHRRFLLDYPVRHFPEYRQMILDEMVRLKKDLSPDIVFCPGTRDVHQDHAVIRGEAVRAFRDRCVLGYEIPHNYTDPFRAGLYVTLNKKQVRLKKGALSIYKTQRHRAQHGCIAEARAKARGAEIRAEYAEAFEVIRWVA